MIKKLILTCSGKDAVHIKKYISDINQDQYKIIATTVESKVTLEKMGISYSSYDQYIGNLDYEYIHSEAFYFWNNWYKAEALLKQKNIVDLCTYKDQYLLRLHRGRVNGFFLEILESIEAIKKIIQVEKPQSLVICEKYTNSIAPWIDCNFTLENRAAVIVGAKMGIPVEIIDPDDYVLNHKFPQINRKVPVKISQKNSRPTILFWIFYHHEKMLDLLKFTANTNQYNIIVIEEYSSISFLKELDSFGIHHYHIDEFHEYNGSDTQTSYQEKFCNAWDLYSNNSYIQDFFTTKDDINFWYLIKDRLEVVFKIELSESMKYVVAAENAVDQINPDLIFLFAVSSFQDQSFGFLAQKKNIPTLFMPHGMNKQKESLTLLHDYKACDKVIAWGETPKEQIVKVLGKKPVDVLVCGFSDFDKFIRDYEKLDVNKAKSKILRLKQGNPIILWATLPEKSTVAHHRGSTYIRYKTVFSFFQENPDLTLIVRGHPSERDMISKCFAGNNDNNIIINPDLKLEEVIKISDIILTEETTVGLYAMLVKKVVAYIELFGEKNWFPYSVSGAVRGIFKLDELKIGLKEMLENPEAELENHKTKRNEFIKKYCYKTDNLISKRINDCIKDMLS